jgi:putative phage-type endonuclease
MLQRSEEWYAARLGRFTASDSERLLGSLGSKATVKKINSYAIEKATEMYFGISEEEPFTSFDMQRGVDLEPLAFELFKDKKDLEFIKASNCSFFKYGEHAGASPDGVCSNNFNLEIKCPRLKTFNELISTDEIDSKYYAQMQYQMMCNEAEGCYFLNYVLHNGEEYSHEILVLRDEEMIDLFKERIIYASEIKENHYNKLVLKFG